MEQNAKTTVVTISARAALVSGVRKALSDVKEDVDKAFVEDLKQALTELGNKTQAVIVVDWDIGASRALKFLESISSRPEREFWQILLIASEQSEKIIAAGTEYRASKVHTGNVTPAKLALTIESLLGDVRQQNPMMKIMSKLQQARKQGEWAQATQLLESLYKKSPDNRRIVHELSENYLQEGSFQKCFDLLHPLKDKTPMDVRLLHTLGKSLIKLGRHDDAAKYLKQAKLLNPFNVERLIGLGHVLLNLDATKEAEQNFAEAERLDPQNKRAVAGRGTAKLMDGEINEALGLLSNQVSGRELASVFNTAAVLSMRLGRFPKGINLYDAAEEALAGQPQTLARVFYNKGLGYYRWKKFSEARACFQKAVDLDPAFENARINLKAVSGETEGTTKKGVGHNTAEVTPAGIVENAPEDNLDFDKHFADTFCDENEDDGLSDVDERF